MNICVWHNIQGLNFATRHAREHFQGLLHAATWALKNRDIDTIKCHDNRRLNTLVNKNESNVHNDILADGKEDCRQ